MSGAVPPPATCPVGLAGGVPRPVCPGCGWCGRADSSAAPQCAPLRAVVSRCGGGRRASPGGVRFTVLRGVWRQPLSFPKPPTLWGRRPGFCNPCVPGAVGVGVGTPHRSHSVRPCEPSLRAVGVAEGGPGGDAVHRCAGRLSSGAPPSPAARPLNRLSGSATHVLWARVCGCGGPAFSPLLACPVGAACRGGGWGPSPGGMAFHRCEGRLVSGAVPSPAAHPPGGGSRGSATLVSRVRLVWA